MSLLAVAGRIACKDVRLFEAFSGPWIPSSSGYTLRAIERSASQKGAYDASALSLQERKACFQEMDEGTP